MTRSEQINELATALAKAQGQLKGVKKDSENPFFKSKYADLAAVWDAIREPLSTNGLAVLQTARLVSVGESSWLVEVESMLMHASGQFITDTLALPLVKVDPQGAGSAITYGRRYGLSALVGVAPEDDDANAAVGPSQAERRVGPGIPRKPRAVSGAATVKVRGIVQRPSAPGQDPKFIVTADDNLTYQTFVKAHAEAAKAAQEASMPVEIKYRQESFGRVIESIAERDAVEPPL